jgi:hypothetical protein
MATYKVTTECICVTEYIVKADSKAEAMDCFGSSPYVQEKEYRDENIIKIEKISGGK